MDDAIECPACGQSDKFYKVVSLNAELDEEEYLMCIICYKIVGKGELICHSGNTAVMKDILPLG